MAEKIITGADFQKRNKVIEEKREREKAEIKKAECELLEKHIISVVKAEWEKRVDEIVDFINLETTLDTNLTRILKDNKEDIESWLKDTMILTLFPDKELGYLLKVPQ